MVVYEILFGGMYHINIDGRRCVQVLADMVDDWEIVY